MQTDVDARLDGRARPSAYTPPRRTAADWPRIARRKWPLL